MSSWDIVKLGQINTYRSQSINPMRNPDQKYVLYSVPSFDNGYPETVSGAEIGSTKQIVLEGDILLCKINPRINRVWIVGKHPDYPVIASSEWIVIRNSNVYASYLAWYLRSEPFRNLMITNVTGIGGSLTRVQPKQVKDYEIPLPPLETQKKIAAVLDKAQELINKRKEQIALLDSFIQSVFVDMFGDPVTNPTRWQIMKLSQIGDLVRGKSKHRPRNAPELLGGRYPLIQTGDIAKSGLFIKEYHQTYSEIGLKQSKLWPKGTLCITIAANIAETGILTFDACFPDSVVAFIPRKGILNIYVQFWLMFLQQSIANNAPESAQKNINLAILSDLEIPVPDFELQNRFQNVVMRTEQQRELMQQSLTQMQNVFDSLMQHAFKGELF